MRNRLIFLLAALSTGILTCLPTKQTVDFNMHVRPILNENCLSCHGGVRQSGGFSLLFEEDALADTESGKPAIVPGKPGQSELIRRINHHDPELRMPFEKVPLSKVEIDVLTQWIRDGAKWERHWAFRHLTRPDPPASDGRTHNEIDRFVLSKVFDAGLTPSAEAPCNLLLRRLSLDLTGLPPRQEMIDRYCADASEAAYSQIVDELLASSQYGERWSAMWMDLARYADTKGFERDPHREIWMYRDWLIRAFNEDKPFDQFTIEQLAGDLLPDATPDQYVATAFHRNTMNNDEGGTNNEEYRVAAVLDRVNTTWEVWQGTSFGCVQCHSHPYDPFRQEEYYQVFDFFNQTADADIFAETPVYRFFEEKDSTKVEAIRRWITEFHPGEEELMPPVEEYMKFLHLTEPKIHPHMCDSLTNGALADTKFLVLYNDGFTRMPAADLANKKELLVSISNPGQGGSLEFRLNALDGPLLGTLALEKARRGYQRVPLSRIPANTNGRVFVQFKPATNLPSSVSINWFVFFEGLPGDAEPGYAEMEDAFLSVLNARTKTVPVMVEHGADFQRATHVFHRGNWQDHGEQVTAEVPGILPPLPEGVVRNRLSLAKWLVSPENPLTARVIVNRFWEQLFGRGIVETMADFGTMGTPPSHPELLDWLAVEFRETHGWSVKKLLRQIVHSATYRQSSDVTDEQLDKDPQNRLWARGARVRLSSEQLRDQALAVSGLLSDKMYGRSVMPPQPDGIWQVVYNSSGWITSTGEDRYRRALYTYWRRTSPYPSFVSFDSPSREVCTSKRINTNTPLQALVSLNDPVYVEAAIHLAQGALRAFPEPEAAMKDLYKKTILMSPSEKTMDGLKAVYQEALDYYSKHPDAVSEFLSQAAFDTDCEGGFCKQLVAMSLVANTVMNLDAFVMKG